jgi:hypothetical protein
MENTVARLTAERDRLMASIMTLYKQGPKTAAQVKAIGQRLEWINAELCIKTAYGVCFRG